MKKAVFVIMFLFAVTSAAGDVFKKHTKWFPVGPNPNSIVATDLNGDNLPEIVTANTGAMNDPRQERPANDEVSVLVARGDLEYEPLPPLRTDFAPYAIAVGNVDALKAPDLVVASFMAVTHKDLTLFRNTGQDLFESVDFAVPETTLSYNRMRDGEGAPIFTMPGLTSVILADVNRDGSRDAIATGWSSDVLVVFPGIVDKYFEEPKLIPAPEGPRDVDTADLNDDGNIDLAVALYTSSEVSLWKGDGTGGFEQATRFGSRGRLPSKIRLCDVNQDGKKDVIVSHCQADDSIVVFYGDGAFSFSTSQEILLGKDRSILEHEIRDLLVTDLNRDGKPDIAAACYGSGQVIVLVNDSEGASLPQKFRQEAYAYENAKPRALCTADFNQDGGADMAVALWDANSVSLLLGNVPPPPKPAQAKK